MRPLDRLKDIAPPPVGAPDRKYSWEDVEKDTGPLPSDYKEFIDEYGAGRFWGELGIAPPGWVAKTRTKPSQGTIDFLREYSSNRAEYVRLAPQDDTVSSDEVAGTPDDLYVQFGVSGTGQSLFWRTLGDDPDKWPVIVTNTSGIDYDPRGMAHYLVGILGGTFASAAFDDEWLEDVTDLNPDQPFVRIEE